MQRRLRVITLQGAIEKSPILLLQYWKNEWLDGTIIISYFGGSNNIFADCTIDEDSIGVTKKQNNFWCTFKFLIHCSSNFAKAKVLALNL